MLELDSAIAVGITRNPPSSLSNNELLLLIDNEYPALQGALLMLAERFRSLLAETQAKIGVNVNCPACGTQIALTWTATKD